MSTVFAPRESAYKRSLSEATTQELTAREEHDEDEQVGFMEWVRKVPEPKTGPLDFDVFPFQRELYEEGVDDKEIAVMKATQIGVSAFSMRWALFHADQHARTGLYVFPTKADMFDFADLRVKPLIDASEYLRERRKPDDPDNKGMKGIGPGKVVFRGSENKRGLDSVDCDHIVFDEYDTLDQNNIPDAEMRVSSPLSPGLIRRVGVPSVPEHGIAKLYDESDQRVWMVTCPECEKEQELDFWKNVDQEREIRACADQECRASLEPVVGDGRWLAKKPGEGRPRGYHVSRLIVPSANIKALIKQSKQRSPSRRKVFFNKHLGLPFAEAEGRLSREAINAAVREYVAASTIDEIYAVPKNGTRTMGVDVATVRDLNVRVSEVAEDGTKVALFLGTVGSFDDLATLMRVYDVNMAAIDHLPDGRLAQGIAEQFPGRVYVVHYNTAPTVGGPVFGVDDDLRTAWVRRTEGIDAAFEQIRMQKNKLPENLPEHYVGDMQALVREVTTDARGRKIVIYSKKGESDDFAHMEVYDLLAESLWLYRQQLEELAEEQFRPLDEMMEFQRSGLAGYGGDDEYQEGPDEDMAVYGNFD